MMKCGFTIGKFITSERRQADLTKVNHQLLVVRRSKFEAKNLCSIFFKSNGLVLIHCVYEGKNIENCLKPVVNQMRKQRKSAGTKGTKLVEDNTRPHIQSDVINYLTEEGITSSIFTCPLHFVIIS